MAYYDDIADGYEELHEEEQMKKIDVVKKYLKVSKDERLLDVGCGIGITTLPWDCERHGIDSSSRLLEKAREKGKINYKLAPAEKIPYPDGFFDIVISITALQNFDDIEKGLREIKRVGKGKFVLSFLKKSPKREAIDRLIRKNFNVSKIIEEDKDVIYFASQ